MFKSIFFSLLLVCGPASAQEQKWNDIYPQIESQMVRLFGISVTYTITGAYETRSSITVVGTAQPDETRTVSFMCVTPTRFTEYICREVAAR